MPDSVFGTRHSPPFRRHSERVALDGVPLPAVEQPRFRAARARLNGGAVQLAAGGADETGVNPVAQSLFSTLRTDSQFSAASVSVEAARGVADESRPRSELNTTNQNNRKK